jgi:uncharacterized protein YbjQ (UPF0145 family)
MENWGDLINLIIFVLLIAVGYIFGSMAEKKHYKSIEKREKDLIHLPAITARRIEINESEIEKAEMVYGSVVISTDYFKRILAGLRKIFGGRMRSYETLIDRARREAVLRMKEKAGNANIIINMRLETSTIGDKSGKKGSVSCVEAIAYGTAITLKS